MSMSDASRNPSRSSRGDESWAGTAPPKTDALSPAEVRELVAQIKDGDWQLEALLSVFMLRILPALQVQDCSPLALDDLAPSICDGLRAAVLDHCPRSEPANGLAAKVLFGVQERVADFLERDGADGDGPAFSGAAWADQHITADLIAECLDERTVASAWPALRRRAEAIRRLVEANVRLASTLAKCKMGGGLEFDDLHQTAAISLEKAARTFDPEVGVPFEGYASQVIRNDLSDAVRTARGGTAHGARQRAEFKAEATRLTQELGRQPIQAEVFERLGWGETKRRNAEQGFLRPQPRSLELHEEETGEFPADRCAADPAVEAETHEDVARAHAALASLDEPERQVFILRHVGPETLTQEETAKRLDMPLSRVRKLEAKARDSLRVRCDSPAPSERHRPRHVTS